MLHNVPLPFYFLNYILTNKKHAKPRCVILHIFFDLTLQVTFTFTHNTRSKLQHKLNQNIKSSNTRNTD